MSVATHAPPPLPLLLLPMAPLFHAALQNRNRKRPHGIVEGRLAPLLMNLLHVFQSVMFAGALGTVSQPTFILLRGTRL